jgi:hypothetical protein
LKQAKLNSGDLEMHNRLVFALALFSISVFTGYAVQPAQAQYCTVQDIVAGVLDGASFGEVQAVCTELDVQCPVAVVFSMAEEGYTASEIYYECG